MLEYIAEHWVLVLILILACILTVFLFIKAGTSSAERAREKKEFIERLDREKALREKYAVISVDLIEKEDDVFEGVVSHIQRRLDKSDDMLSMFDSMPQSMKYIYTAFYVFDDTEDGLNEFFKKNGQPLTGLAADAVTAIFDEELGAIVREQWAIYDEENEEKSVIEEEYEIVNKKFKNKVDGLDIASSVKNYIIKNIVDFV